MREAGAQVYDLSGSGGGVPDTLVYTPDIGLKLVEIKVAKGKPTPKQVKFHARFPVEIVRTKEEALSLLNPSPER